MQSIDFTIIKSSIDNGRLYFESGHTAFFPFDAMGPRGGGKPAAGKVDIVASGDTVETDIRVSSKVRISPRKSFKKWLSSVQAVDGGKARLHRVADRQYRLEYLG